MLTKIFQEVGSSFNLYVRSESIQHIIIKTSEQKHLVYNKYKSIVLIWSNNKQIYDLWKIRAANSDKITTLNILLTLIKTRLYHRQDGTSITSVNNYASVTQVEQA